MVVDEEAVGFRLDQFLAQQDSSPTRSQLKGAIERGEVTVNGRVVKPGHSLQWGERVEVALIDVTSELIAEDIPLHILFEDDSVIVLVKPADLVVHPAAGHPTGTLVNALLHHCGPQLSEAGDPARPGLVHRLDKDTTGVMVVAKNLASHAHLAQQFEVHSTTRRYLALCLGPGFPDHGTFDTLHGRHPVDRKRFSSKVERGKRAVTHYEVLERFRDGVLLVRCQLETGRSHQVRVHLSENGAPILGDPLYGGRAAASTKLIQRPALHAESLEFEHPVTHERLSFTQPPPEDFAAALDALRRGGAWR
ncbi:MAG: hypothetical protein AUK47_20605 [Deltaproteobacteria bacterium CG2_30_63_29]|nr:MAG: hypothetical protein AUK47_20605 [Deltaproteobacteria bacterium CG2_30_63_29]PJB38908.1 MAG: RluA family pseudouridine synthase [Deltaproteobacteria bacterium CG_4_9_14_3_um_filter_63_12]